MKRLMGRVADERTLDWVRLRHHGVHPETIAKRYGVSESFVRERTNSVKSADMDYDKTRKTRSKYW